MGREREQKRNFSLAISLVLVAAMFSFLLNPTPTGQYYISGKPWGSSGIQPLGDNIFEGGSCGEFSYELGGVFCIEPNSADCSNPYYPICNPATCACEAPEDWYPPRPSPRGSFPPPGSCECVVGGVYCPPGYSVVIDPRHPDNSCEGASYLACGFNLPCRVGVSCSNGFSTTFARQVDESGIMINAAGGSCDWV